MDQDETWPAGRPRPWRHCIRWEPSSPPLNGHSPLPMFGSYLLWPNGWMDQDATCYGDRPRFRPHCARWGPSSPQKGGTAPNFRLMSIVAKRSPISATAEHLSYRCYQLSNTSQTTSLSSAVCRTVQWGMEHETTQSLHSETPDFISPQQRRTEGGMRVIYTLKWQNWTNN